MWKFKEEFKVCFFNILQKKTKYIFLVNQRCEFIDSFEFKLPVGYVFCFDICIRVFCHALLCGIESGSERGFATE